MKKVLDTYFLFFQINQSTATLRHVFAALRLFVQKVRQKDLGTFSPDFRPRPFIRHVVLCLPVVPQHLLPGKSRSLWTSLLRDPQVLQPPLQFHTD